jgi:hypothetical protein
LAIVIFIATRVPFAAFREASGRGPQLALAAFDFGMMLIVLAGDSLATWAGLIATKLRRPFGEVVIARGATYALFVVNYAVGQGAFGFYLHRTGTKPLRATGATLFLVGINLIALILLTTIAWAFGDAVSRTGAVWWSLVATTGAFAIYLVVIAIAPTFLARRELFAPLFDAGIRGHALALVARLPHTCIIVLGQWLAVRVWGVPVPFTSCLTIVPLVVIASVIPISPGGLGTTQAAFLYFFTDLAPGATSDERSAYLIAFGIAHFVYGIAASALVGFAFLPTARKRGLFARPA